jgi:hypothetical protein
MIPPFDSPIPPAPRFPVYDPYAAAPQFIMGFVTTIPFDTNVFIIEVAVPPGVIVIWALIEIESHNDRNNK